ncbi:ribonuclease HII [Anaerosporomusa subterranea]|uniref:Ribonuclease HII n=1 Tax=Anaerosporomusa subterranea TaxID=1794912 RepID=A0A154BUY7_ANASB|nr:ribonuclease HII [Anaerosporomusa subterranea]KYZ77318.1 ribonuclease HII [Anaerosporomusa subterranea]
MKTEPMKVSQIASLLQHQQELPLQVVESLRTDPRPTVKRLFEKWITRGQRHEQEIRRVRELYLYESVYYNQCQPLVAGIDEAGRGPLAGPVVVAAVILPKFVFLPGLNDSKQVSAAQREKLYYTIKETALAINWQSISVDLIDEINIYQATVRGMYQAAAALQPAAQAVLIDAVKLPELTIPWQAIIGGDALSASIAAASVIAKVERDRIMLGLNQQYPGYGFDKHKGYGTKEHLDALRRLGPSPVHRRSFEPVKSGGGLFGFEAGYARPVTT